MVKNGRKCITYIYYIIKQLLTYVSVDVECYFISLSAILNLPYVGGAGLLLRTGGPNNWVNIDMEYSIIVTNVSRV